MSWSFHQYPSHLWPWFSQHSNRPLQPWVTQYEHNVKSLLAFSCHSWVECALKESHSSFEYGFQSRIVVKDFLFLFLQFFLNLRGHSCFGRWCFMYREIFGLLGIGPEAPGPASHLCQRIFPCPESWFLVRPWSSLPIGKKSLDWRPIISSPTSSSDVSLSWKLRTCCPGVLFVHSLLGDLGIVAKCSSLVDNCCIYVFS